jgi:hypothetical protein
MIDYVKAWQCIGCGKIEAPQPCIGVCQDRKVQFVYVEDYEEALVQTRQATRRAETLQTLVRQLAVTTPREGEWEQCYRALQSRARRTITELATEDVDLAASAEKSA